MTKSNIIGAKLTLASKSPRRKELLEQAGFEVSILSIDVAEVYPPDTQSDDVAEYLARLKAKAAMELVPNDAVLITADTVVVHDNQILGKPQDLAEAKAMIRSMAGNAHEVYTGVALVYQGKLTSFTSKTHVALAEMTDTEIDHYVENYSVLDKAGAYGIQDWIGWCKVTKLEGSYSNVMGLPVARLYKELEHLFDKN